MPCHKSALRWGGRTGKHCAALEPEHHWGASLSGMLGASAQLMASGWADRSARRSQAASEAGRTLEAMTTSAATHSSEATTTSWPRNLDTMYVRERCPIKPSAFYSRDPGRQEYVTQTR